MRAAHRGTKQLAASGETDTGWKPGDLCCPSPGKEWGPSHRPQGLVFLPKVCQEVICTAAQELSVRRLPVTTEEVTFWPQSHLHAQTLGTVDNEVGINTNLVLCLIWRGETFGARSKGRINRLVCSPPRPTQEDCLLARFTTSACWAFPWEVKLVRIAVLFCGRAIQPSCSNHRQSQRTYVRCV